MSHATAVCDHCGKSDDHPKLHYGADTYHHDCLPAKVRADVGSDPAVAQIIEAAEGGTRGAKLRAHIVKLHEKKG